MCGIAGIVSKKGVAAQQIKMGTAALHHRGPESEGFYFNSDNTVGFGHRRLCIIDLSGAAQQPLIYAGRYTIVYNGELYNYIELREQLIKKGFAFSSKSDTEVVVACYAAFGASCLQHFDGAFAFAIWDEEEKTLFAARDRLGEKPLFYSFENEELVFASEQKALWKMGVQKGVNAAMVYNFLTIDYSSNPYNPSETFYEGVASLPPASFLHYTLPTATLTIEKYWQPFIEVDITLGEEQAVEQFINLFSTSVNRRLRADVAIGTSLSGGLDSSAIVAFCKNAGGNSYTHKCFTAAFGGFAKNELPYASLVANTFNLQHTVVSMPEEDIVGLMSEVMYHQEEPILSSSALAQYLVYKAAKQNGVTVLLDGQGADEILGGYHKYFKWYWQELYRQKDLKSSKEIEAAHALGITEPFGIKNKAVALFPQLLFALQKSKKKKDAFQLSSLNRDFAFANKEQFYYSLPAEATLNSALFFNSFQYGLQELLRMADRNSMAHGVEIRLPFLSHQLVEFLFTLPPGFKIKNGWTKWLLRKATENQLPKEIVWRKDKVGFEPPQKKWMENKNVQEAIQSGKELLAKKNVLNARTVSQKIKPHDAHAAENMDWKYWAISFLYA